MSEYLKRELIANVEYDINNDSIRIQNDNTDFVHINRVKPINKNELLLLYRQVNKLAKEKNISISRKNGYKKYITENWIEYENEIKYYNNLFNKAINKYKEVQQRGIHFGCSDDTVLNEAGNIKNQYIKMYYRNSICSHIHDIYNKLNELYEGFTKYNKNYTKIFI
jgi:hypothetical protein